MFRYVQPAVAGFWGEQTLVDMSVHPPIVHQLDYQFDGWLGDDILETFPCFIVSERLRGAIEDQEFTGVVFDKVIISRGKSLPEDLILPTFYWLKVVGTPRQDDFAIAEDYRLIVSHAVYLMLKSFNVLPYMFTNDHEPLDL